jgi:2,3-bisphosphoglycerate-dependent phosphoglycerate mutase
MNAVGTATARYGCDSELLLVRHAEAWCNVEDIVGGPLGCRGLTPFGRTQADRLAARLSRSHISGERRVDTIYCSPRLRAVQTAEPIAEALGLRIQLKADLREQDLGVADGRPRSELYADCEGNPALQPWREPAVGGESWFAYAARVRHVIDNLTADNCGRRLVAGPTEFPDHGGSGPRAPAATG